MLYRLTERESRFDLLKVVENGRMGEWESENCCKLKLGYSWGFSRCHFRTVRALGTGEGIV